MKNKISFKLNGKETSVEVNGMTRLLDVIREKLQFTGTKEGCGEGECGACSVVVNGEIVNSCLIPVIQMQGAEIDTIESFSITTTLNAIQEAFLVHGGAQCGMCTPGMLLAAKDLLKRTPKPSEKEIREALAGNLCRCTGYTKIVESVIVASRKISSGAVL